MIGETTFLPNFFNLPNSLMQAARQTRDDYYQICVEDPENESNQIAFINILAFNIYGDGIITLPFPSPSPSPVIAITCSPTSTPIITPTAAPTASPTPTAAPTAVITASPAASVTPTPIPAPSVPHLSVDWDDYDGDGTSDLAVYDPTTGEWSIENITTGLVWGGGEGDIPAPGDYDGDGSADLTTFRNKNGEAWWWIRYTSKSYYYSNFSAQTTDSIVVGATGY